MTIFILKIIAVIIGWIVLGFISTWLSCKITDEHADLETFCLCTLFAPFMLPVNLVVIAFKSLFKLYVKIFDI